MVESSSGAAAPTPKHLWIVGILGFLWSSMGATIYLMAETRNEGYMQSFTPEQRAFFEAYPSWFVALWAIAVWGGVLGSILLLLRRSLAVWVLLASLVGVIVTNIRNYGIENGLEVIGSAFDLIIVTLVLVISVFLLAYARAMKAQGILR